MSSYVPASSRVVSGPVKEKKPAKREDALDPYDDWDTEDLRKKPKVITIIALNWTVRILTLIKVNG
jgi:hypothetical protein